ncbi:hypothetical protein M2158_001082 [Streptomyces sp. SAI-144]|uniref:hypothetical protein n=1 Tax=Streptomyces sp. SAI-144 TaxID=2940544 RepID=UPI0024760F94|nr:hypothetical protein [Streptomyces sp. SAI-144]MDH6432605.1 hypothetical protein [Streptomyces sp. SAI-144]
MIDTPETNPVVAALPGAGWFAEYVLPDGTTQQYPLAAWLVRADGTLEPVDMGEDGYAEDPRGAHNFARLVQPQAGGRP